MNAEPQRTNSVLARYRGSLSEYAGANLAKRWPVSQGAFISSLFFIAFLAMYEPALIWPKLATASTLGGSVAVLRWLPLPGLAIQSWAIHRLLSLNTPLGVRPRSWLLLLRFVFGCIPLAGVIAIPFWDAVQKGLPAWGFRGIPKVASLALHENHSGVAGPLSVLRRRRLTRLVPFGSLMFGGFLTYFLGAWLATTGRLRPTFPVLVAFVFVHVIVAGTSFLSESADLDKAPLSPRRRRFLRSLSWLWLFPIPVGVFGWMLQQRLSGYIGLTEGLVAHLFHGSSRSRSLAEAASSPSSRWRHRWAFQVRRTPPEKPSKLRVENFHRWKTLLLALDAAVAFSLAEWIARSIPALRSFVAHQVLLAVFASFGFGLLGLLHSALDKLEGLLKPLARQHLPSRFSGSGLLRTQASFLLGGACGLLAFNPKDDRAVWVLTSGAGLALMLPFGAKTFARYLRAVLGHEVPAPWEWAAIGFALSAISTWMILAPTPRRLGLQVLTVAGILTPLWSYRLYRALGRWTFRPFSPRDVFDPRFPLRLRAGVAFLMFTSALPFGGLGSPIAIPLRRSLWPDAERRWWAIERQRTPAAPPSLSPPL